MGFILRKKIDLISYFILNMCRYLIWSVKLLNPHSMARTNLNKSEWLVTNTWATSKYIPKRPRICIDWNPPFQTKIYFVKVPLNVIIVNEDFCKKQFLKKSLKWSLKGGISIDTDSGPLRYVFWCWGSISLQFSVLFSLATAILCPLSTPGYL